MWFSDKLVQEFGPNSSTSGAARNGIWVNSNDLFISMMTTIHTQEVYMIHPEQVHCLVAMTTVIGVRELINLFSFR